MLLPELSPLLRRCDTKTRLAFLHCRRLGDLLSFSSVTTAAAVPKAHFMVDYLITTCGLSPSEAAEASKHLRRIKSPQQPDSVLSFLKSHGFNDADVRKLVSGQPRCLGFDVEKTLAPKFRALRDFGFTQSDLHCLILFHPHVLKFMLHRTLLPRIEFWRDLHGSVELLMKSLKRKIRFLGCSVEKRILPNLSLLRDCGIPEQRISLMVKQQPSIIVRRPDSLRDLVGRMEGVGIPRHSGMFGWALIALHMSSKAQFEAKMELMRRLGWTDSEFLAAFCKAPCFLAVSKKLIQRKMEFLVKEAGCTPSYVARFPTLLMYSLDRRMIPRYRAMEILKSKGLHNRKCKLNSFMSYTEKDFFKKFILHHKEKVPELHEMFVAGCKKDAQ